MTEIARRKQLLMLTLSGADEHNGHVMAHALADKLDQFLKTFARFERAFLKERTRQTDFEIALLQHNSPATMGLNPIPRSAKHLPAPVVAWTLDQWERIASGRRPDDVVDDELVGDVAALAHRADPLAYAGFDIAYEHRSLRLDDEACFAAQQLQKSMQIARPMLPWRRGVSKGVVVGRLESVLNEEQQRQIVICPFVGAEKITCQFTDEIKDQIRDALFKVVRIRGLLHYTDDGPYPVLIDIEEIERVELSDKRPRFLEAAGLFKDSVYPPTEANAL